MFTRNGAVISRQTMVRWTIQVADKLMPLYNLLQDRLLEKNYVQMDETRVQVLNEKGKKATSKSYMWVRHAPGNRLKKLSGTLKGFYSIRINDQFRIIFKWSNNEAHEVKVVDYHQ